MDWGIIFNKTGFAGQEEVVCLGIFIVMLLKVTRKLYRKDNFKHVVASSY